MAGVPPGAPPTRRRFLARAARARAAARDAASPASTAAAATSRTCASASPRWSRARRRREQPERLRFPPLLPRRDLETIGYLKSFPHLAGSVFAFDGHRGAGRRAVRARRAATRTGASSRTMTELVLTPAACYPVYPAIAARGPLPPGGVTVDAGGAYVFRHEPSGDPARLQMFHQREIVRIGEPETVLAWRDAWRERGLELLRGARSRRRARRRHRPVLRAQRPDARRQPARRRS